MKKLPLIVPVLALFSLYVLSSPIIWATYYVYQDYIAEEFCVNKQNPDCCGKCYINEVEDEQPANALPRIEVRTPELMSFVILKLKFHPALFRIPISFTSICSGDVSIGFPRHPVHPPEFYFSI